LFTIVSGQPVGPIFKDQGSPETTVADYRYSLRNNAEERSSHQLHGGSLKSSSRVLFRS